MRLFSRAVAGACALALLLAACAPATRSAPPAVPEPTPGPTSAPAEPAAAAERPAPAWPVIAPTPGAEEYVAQVLSAQQGRVARWERAPGRPIAVWIPALPDAGATDYPAIVEQAMAAWNEVGLPVRFARAADSASAEVHVRWVRTDAEADVAGRARVRIDGRTDHITRATVALATHAPSGYPHAAPAALGFALHELGHVLGIQHTGRSDCIMFPLPQRAAFCAADRETARRWYALPTGLADATLRRD